MKVPCGRMLGHGDSCSAEDLCEQCTEIMRLRTAFSGMQKAVSQLHEAVDAIERLGTALIAEKAREK